MKKIIILIFLFAANLSAQFKFGDAKGLFMSVGVGPRIPIGSMAENQNIGSGSEVTFSYTDNRYIPFFIYTTIGFIHFPGREDLYKKSDYSSFSSNVLTISPGMRYYFKPILENVVLLMPIVDAGINWALFEKLHQFKIDSQRNNFVEDVTKFGFQIGAGFSMFILDVITYYNFYPSDQFFSFNLKANIPIFVKF